MIEQEKEMYLYRVLGAFRFVGLTMKEFAEAEGIKPNKLYTIRYNRRATKEIYNFIISTLETKYSAQYEKIKELIEQGMV